MFCHNCGTQLDNNAKFCFKCGMNLAEGTPPQQIPGNSKASFPAPKKLGKKKIIIICSASVVLIGLLIWLIATSIPSAEKTLMKCLYADRNMNAQEYVETLYGANFKIGYDPSEYLNEYIIYYDNKREELGSDLQRKIASEDYQIISSEDVSTEDLRDIIEKKDYYHYDVSGITEAKRINYIKIYHHDNCEDTYDTKSMLMLKVNGKWYADY